MMEMRLMKRIDGWHGVDGLCGGDELEVYV